MGRDGLSCRAALAEGRGDDACAASVEQAGLIFFHLRFGPALPPFTSLVDDHV